jgi:glycosyltransferase involved in cell wall biosynthesis
MRIAYITPYQGPTVVNRRPIVRNRSVSNKIKIELIARLLHASSHQVEIISHGEVIEHKLKLYRGFWETDVFHASIPIYYVSSLPIKRLNGFWSGTRALQFLKKRHQVRPYDLVIIFNLKPPQVSCATYAIKQAGLPVILQYEDDVFVSVVGQKTDGWVSKYHRYVYKRILNSVSGCMAVSPHLLSQLPSGIPMLLLRGVVGDDVLKASEQMKTRKRNWVVFSGTHIESNGVRELIAGWKIAAFPDWELHITGFGGMTEELRKMAENRQGVIFHGLVSRQELVRLICSAKICINPHAVSQTPGNVFAFKIIEYLAAGAHVVSTPMGTLEPEMERGITYMPDNKAETIAAALKQVIKRRCYERTASEAALQSYGTAAVSESIKRLIQQVLSNKDGMARGRKSKVGGRRTEDRGRTSEISGPPQRIRHLADPISDSSRLG